MSERERPGGESGVAMRAILTPGFLVGFGLGGLFDVIVLHQILQWHHQLSSIYSTATLAGLRRNVLADGLLSAAMWALAVLGGALLWRAVGRADLRGTSGALTGALLVGWGSFHVFDEFVNHRIVGAHHIRPGPNALAYDVGFFTVGVLLVAGGLALIRRG